MFKIKLTINSSGLGQKLERLKNLPDLSRGTGQKIADMLLGELQQNFASQGAHFGQPWPGAGFWAKLMRRRADGRKYRTIDEVINDDVPALHDTGALEASLQKGQRYNIVEIGKDYIRVGTSHPAAKRLQEGGSVTADVSDRAPSRSARGVFEMSPELLARNFAVKVNGRYNPDYFKLLHTLRGSRNEPGMSGRVITIPARKIVGVTAMMLKKVRELLLERMRDDM